MLYWLEPEEFDSMFDIMEASFPEDEIRPYDEQRALLEDPAFGILVLKDHAAEPIKGFVTVWDLGAHAFFEHLAINPVMRNGGLGAEMLNSAVALVNKPVCLEVELPSAEMPRRRIAFYERNGFCYNDYPYIQPPISKGRKPVPLAIMTTGGSISRAEFESIRELLYSRVYRISKQ